MDVGTGAMASLLPMLVELLNEKYKLQASIREDVEYLSREMKSMHASLHKVAEVPRDQLDVRVKLWAGKVRQLSYNMDVAVDSCLLSLTSSEVSKGLIKKMCNLFKKDKTCHQIVAAAIKDMKLQLEEVVHIRARYNIDNIVPRPAAMTSIDHSPTALYTKGGDLVGIDGKRDQELMRLLSDGDNASSKKLKIVSVVGFVGLGKTTLVKAVYDKIQMDFDCKAFVPVGQNADTKKVFRDMISQLTMDNNYNNTVALDEQLLIDKLREILKNKRYLVVIDDIWDEELWKRIKIAFSNHNNLGSRIITTTRIVSVSEACCSSSNDSIYQMEPLSDDDSKKLMYDRIFGSVSRCSREFEQVSSDILKKCGGVPLAIIAMSSVLAGDPWMKSKDEWHVLLRPIGHTLIEDSSWKEMQRIVSFSYYDLPSHLKTCLLYLSTFPGGHPIERDRLVKKWITERMIFVDNLRRSPEEQASQYFDELVNRNVIHPLEWNDNSEVISYHIHHLMHDFLKTIAIEEKFAASLVYKDISSADDINFPHLSVECPDTENLIGLSSMAFDCSVRSLTVFGYANRILLGHFEGIQHLDLEGCKSIERADLEYICSMVLLKHLWLAKTQITELPPQIGNLQNLEGLDVRGTQISELPPQIVWLTRLVHLLISEGVKLPYGIGKMTSLQKLGTIDPRKCSASSLRELAEHPYLKEIAVVLTNEPEDTRMNDVLFSSLDKSTKLRSLVVCSDFRLRTVKSTPYILDCRKKLTVVRTSLKVPDAIAEDHFLILRVLDIRVCKLEEDDLKILGKLPKLQSLIVRLEVLPTTMVRISCEGFAKLERFYVDCRMPRVVFEEGAMPKLKHLELKVYGGTASEEQMGINHLLNLRKVTLRYSRWYATSKGVSETTEALKAEAKEHQNEITLCIAEEEKNGTCNTKTEEVFQENRVASCSRVTD